ncbi:ribosomal protein S18 acetylase RimI-like enzyme [Salsuginibacillus halophilus]|uniref:Ribosomal protein S18 acetylase RimI-like enzyme n=1 Tax=Salsuginibacillus halophilus TaxID=517424 RepID=A0A2P8HXL4_9BACI|nr:ribosomal protein S18 acetylase RimI-like enzyme [Salsuginibacillus halophilus]
MKIYEVTSQATNEEIEQIANLLMGQMESIGEDHAYDRLRTAMDEALSEEAPAHLVVAEKDGEMLGAAFFNVSISLAKGGSYIWLNDLYVHKSHRNQGIAKKLLRHVIHWAENHNMKGIELETGVNNQATKALYNSLGFYDIVSKRYGFRF